MCGGKGGVDGNTYYVNSCEINVAGTNIWSFITSLPGARLTVRGLTIDNRVLMMGNIFLFDFQSVLRLSFIKFFRPISTNFQQIF